MRKEVITYTCDNCGAGGKGVYHARQIAEERSWTGLPKGWTKIGGSDHCKLCSEAVSYAIEVATEDALVLRVRVRDKDA